jgi:hypothetical protein
MNCLMDTDNCNTPLDLITLFSMYYEILDTPLDMTTIMPTDFHLELRLYFFAYLCKCILFMLIMLCIFYNVSFKDPHIISFLSLYNVLLFYPFLSLIVLNSFVCYLNALFDKSVERDLFCIVFWDRHLNSQ